MGDSALEALRLQALQSLKQKKPENVQNLSNVNSGEVGTDDVKAPVFIGSMASTKKVQPKPKQAKMTKKQKRKAKAQRAQQAQHLLHQQPQQRPMSKVQTLPVGTSGLDPSTLFSMFTKQIITKAGSAGHGPAQPPPMPSSFHLKAPVPVSRKNRGPKHVIDLDTTEDDDYEYEEDDKEEDHSSVEDEMVRNEMIPELTRPVVSSPEPGEISPASSEEHSKALARLKLIKASLEEVDRAYFQNEDLIGSAVKKQNEFKAKARQYRALVKKGKVMKKELYQKKSELLYQLTRAKQAFAQAEYLEYQRPSILVNSPVLPLDLEVVAPVAPVVPTGQFVLSPVEAGERRRAEYEELEKKLNRVQQDLEQSKLSLIKTKTQKAEKKRLKKDKDRNPLRALVIKSTRNESPAQVKAGNPLIETEAVNIEGSVYPLSMIIDLWTWIKSLHPPLKLNSPSCADSVPLPQYEYESPLRWFKSSIFFDHFLDFVSKKGLLSSTFANKIDPMMPFCKAEFEFGCTDKTCMFQHLNQVQISNDALLENLIQRLLELTPKEEFDSKADVLQFIQEKLSEKSLKGVPIVTLITRLLELKKDITEEPVFVKPLQPTSEDTSEPIDKKSAKTTLKNFITAASSLPGRSFFELTKDHLRGESQGYRRYYCFADEEVSTDLETFLKGIPEHGSGDEERQAALGYLCNYQTENHIVRMLCLDFASAISRSPLTSCPNEPLSKPLLWLCFYLTNSFQLKCALTNKLLGCLESSFELVNLILGLAKCAIDSGMTAEVNVLFLAILKSQMSITADDIIPCAQLCTLGFDMDMDAKIRLWLFYLEYLHTTRYNSRWFCEYPYDGCVDYEFMLIGEFKNASLFEMTKTCLLHLLDEVASVEHRTWIEYNLVGVSLESGMSLDNALVQVQTDVAQLLNCYLAIPEEPSTAMSNPLAVLLQARSLSMHGLRKMSSDLIHSFNDTNGADQFSLLLHSLNDTEKLADLVSRHDGLLYRLGKSVLFSTPVHIHTGSLDTVMHRVVPWKENEELEMVRARQAIRYLVDAENDLERLCDRILTNPAEPRLWNQYKPHI